MGVPEQISHVVALADRLSKKGARAAAALEALDRRELELLALATTLDDDPRTALLHKQVAEQIEKSPVVTRPAWSVSAGKRPKGGCT